MKAFLSHSSKDKHYVEKVAEKLTTNWCTYDKFSFEEASETAEEIVKNLALDDIFVFFISQHSLHSDWVKKELEEVHKLSLNGAHKKILPIIIDDTKYDDKAIPEWLKETYNIQPIKKYIKAIHRIRQELIKLSWIKSNNKHGKENLFVGRNSLIDKLEEKHRENYYPPFAVIASGIDGIGRRTLLREYLQKVRIAEKSKYLPQITLEINESIEDLILKLDELGLSSQDVCYENIAQQTLSEKLMILEKIINEIYSEKEVIFIEDNGCIVLPDRSLNQWFINLIENIKINNNIKTTSFAIISKYKLNKHMLVKHDNIYAIDVPEMESKEVNWLLKDLIKIEKLELLEEEFNFIKNLLYGHPEQVLYAVKLLVLESYQYIKNNSYLIVDFNNQKTAYLLKKYQGDIKAKSFLSMLSKFDFIDYEMLNSLIGQDKEYKSLFEQFISESICYEIGANKENIKMNKAIRDTIRRSEWKLSNDLEVSIKEHLSNFLETYKTDDKTLSDYFYSIQESLIKNDNKIDIKNVLPSHILKTIITLYDVKKSYKQLIDLANIALYESFNDLDKQIENQIRLYLCLAYVRKGDYDKFLKEVKFINGVSHNFLMGFYLRTQGRYEEAINKLMLVINESPEFLKAKRELVQVYISIHDYETALELARNHYYNNKHNPYAFQAYSTCLLKTYNIQKDEEIKNLYDHFRTFTNGFDKASEMFEIEQAKYLSLQGNDDALNIICDVEKKYSDSIYPSIAKFDIATKLNKLIEIEKAYNELEEKQDMLPNKSILIINKAVLLAKKNNLEAAKIHISSLKHYPEEAKNKILKRLENTVTF